MMPLQTYCENIQQIWFWIGHEETLKITDKCCDVIACINCPMHPIRFKLKAVKFSKEIQKAVIE